MLVVCRLVRILSTIEYVCCVCMRDMISEFNSEIEGSLAFCALILFQCSILCLMCSGSSLYEECILPFGMLCLSAWRMMLVKMVYAVYMSGGGRMSEKVASVSVCLFCCSLYLMRVLMGRWSEFSACIVRLYSVVEIVVMSGEVACCSVVCGTLVGVSVFSVMSSELLIMSEISCPLWSSVCEYQTLSVHSRRL